MQDDINAAYLWSIKRRLRWSLDKLIYFHAGCRLADHVFTCGPRVTKQSTSVKDLGVMFYNNVSFREHYYYIFKKAYVCHDI